MRKLFTPFSVNGTTLKNRIVMPGLASFLIDEDGGIGDHTVAHYRTRASGGAAMVIMEACAVSPEGVVSNHQARIYDDRFIPGLSEIAGAIKAGGAVAGLQIHHGGRQTAARIIGRKPLAPSPLPCPTIKGDVEPLTTRGIQELVMKFGDAADRALRAGFEWIEIHGAHGYLINQFLSGYSNIRTDRYGGGVRNRTRFAEEIVREVRGRIGPGIPLSFKISAQEFVEGGLTVPESIEILHILVAAGIDLVQVSAGNDATTEWICQPMFMEKACLADSAGLIRRALDIPVMAVGRINDPVVADEILCSGKADLVGIARGLLADPDLPDKAKAGRFEEIRNCIACNTCMDAIFRKGRIECLVNPALGREKELAIHPAAVPKRILVVGGGPAGMNVAWLAASRGHSVDLYEQNRFLGGQLVGGGKPVFKRELMNIVRFQKSQIEKYGVTTHLGHRVTPADIRAALPDAVILAAGSVPLVPQVEGIDNQMVVLFDRIHASTRPTAKNVAVIGGGSTGCEIALFLAMEGCRVTLVEMRPHIGNGLTAMVRRLTFQYLTDYGVALSPAIA